MISCNNCKWVYDSDSVENRSLPMCKKCGYVICNKCGYCSQCRKIRLVAGVKLRRI